MESKVVDPVDLFKRGDYTLHSGSKSKFIIDCKALSQGSIETLAEWIKEFVGAFKSVEGVPTGGLRLADALAKFCCREGPHLIVDDVLTTGRSMEEAREKYLAEVGYRGDRNIFVAGVVLFARGPCPMWVRPMFPMPFQLWVKKPETISGNIEIKEGESSCKPSSA